MTEGPRCSEWARAEGVEPVGTAGTYDGFLLLEWPLPWPKDVGDVDELAPVVAATKALNIRLQGLVPAAADEAPRRALLYRRPDPEWFGGYARSEVVAPAGELVDAAVALVEHGDGTPNVDGAAFTGDVLVCTHGRRDVCCGSKGTALATELEADEAGLGDTVRLWRTSHTGGHRFAPTAIVLPAGTMWAFLDAGALRRIVDREGSLDDLLPRYRGCAGIGPAAVQALERAAFAEIGWEWLDWRRRGSVGDGGGVRLEAQSPTDETAVWTARALAGRTLPVPVCGQPLAAAEKSETEIRLEAITRAS